jgi:hypothetical protein
MAGDWRLTVTLPQHADAEDFMEWLSVNLPEGDVTRDGPRIHVYADDPRGVKYVEHVVATMCDELETPAYVVVDRWNPGDEAWQPPGIPVEEPEPRPPDPAEVDLGAAEVEVLLRSPGGATGRPRRTAPARRHRRLLARRPAPVGTRTRCLAG